MKAREHHVKQRTFPRNTGKDERVGKRELGAMFVETQARELSVREGMPFEDARQRVSQSVSELEKNTGEKGYWH